MSTACDLAAQSMGTGVSAALTAALSTASTLHEVAAKFYRDVFELAPRNKQADDPNEYVTDGHMTLVIMPCDITDYDGTGIITAGMDHIGFKVESVAAVQADLDRVGGENPHLAPSPLGSGKEGKPLHDLFRRSCPLGQLQLADSDGILIDIHE